MATHAGRTISVAVDLDPSVDLADAAAFAALSWVEVPNVGEFPEYGRTESIATYKTTKTTLKGKGVPDFGGGAMEVARVSGNAAHAALRAAGAKNLHVAFKIDHVDATGAANPAYSATADFVKGVISGPTRGGSGDEDFIVDAYELGFTQVVTSEPAQIAPAGP